MARTFDTIIAGGGIVGLALARELRARDSSRTIAVFDKEPALGKHASGRNSGVLHSGIYYPPASLKGKLCSEGARLMREYCDAQALPIDRSGKVIVPVRDGDDAQLDVLLDRARTNGARAEVIDAAQLRELEPEARSVSGRALFSPNTAVIDPKAVLAALHDELREKNVDIILGHEVRIADGRSIMAGGERYEYGFFMNAAGLHADRLAHAMGVGERYTILPFKGIYYALAADAPISIRHLIYPVPDLRVPFLGVHVTRSVKGDIHLGPTAVPALGRENYHGVDGITLTDLASIGMNIVRQYASNKQGFRTLVHEEATRFMKSKFVEAAQMLVPRIESKHLVPGDKVGIRAQLCDREKGELVMDFVVERGEHSLHVLNAVSPGFTTSFAFVKYLLDAI